MPEVLCPEGNYYNGRNFKEYLRILTCVYSVQEFASVKNYQ
jgi:hypothetical protein